MDQPSQRFVVAIHSTTNSSPITTFDLVNQQSHLLLDKVSKDYLDNARLHLLPAKVLDSTSGTKPFETKTMVISDSSSMVKAPCLKRASRFSEETEYASGSDKESIREGKRAKKVRFSLNEQDNRNHDKNRMGRISKHHGVKWIESLRVWSSKIEFDGKSIHLGYFKREIDAALAYDRKAVELFSSHSSKNNSSASNINNNNNNTDHNNRNNSNHKKELESGESETNANGQDVHGHRQGLANTSTPIEEKLSSLSTLSSLISNQRRLLQQQAEQLRLLHQIQLQQIYLKIQQLNESKLSSNQNSSFNFLNSQMSTQLSLNSKIDQQQHAINSVGGKELPAKKLTYSTSSLPFDINLLPNLAQQKQQHFSRSLFQN